MRRWTLGVALSLLLVSSGGLAVADEPNVLVITMNSTEPVRILGSAGVYNVTAASTPSELKAAWTHLSDYDIITWSYHEFSSSYASRDFLASHTADLVAYVKDGGSIMGVTRDDPADNEAVLDAFGVHYDGSDVETAATFSILAPDSPLFERPHRIEVDALRDQQALTADATYVDSGLSSVNPAIVAVAGVGADAAPAILAGQVGAGKVIFSGVEFLNPLNATPINTKLVRNMVAWLGDG